MSVGPFYTAPRAAADELGKWDLCGAACHDRRTEIPTGLARTGAAGDIVSAAGTATASSAVRALAREPGCDLRSGAGRAIGSGGRIDRSVDCDCRCGDERGGEASADLGDTIHREALRDEDADITGGATHKQSLERSIRAIDRPRIGVDDSVRQGDVGLTTGTRKRGIQSVRWSELEAVIFRVSAAKRAARRGRRLSVGVTDGELILIACRRAGRATAAINRAVGRDDRADALLTARWRIFAVHVAERVSDVAAVRVRLADVDLLRARRDGACEQKQRDPHTPRSHCRIIACVAAQLAASIERCRGLV